MDHARRDGALVPAVARAAAVLDAVATEVPAGVGPGELARRLNLPKSSVAAICVALSEVGFLHRGRDGYKLGFRLAELGARYLAGIDEVQAFYEACSEAVESFEETIQLATIDEAMSVTYLARRDGSSHVRLMSAIGRPLPANCTATGKALLASLPADDLARRLNGVALPGLTANSITSHAGLLKVIDMVRQQGWATDNEETTEGVFCLAAPLGHSWATSYFAVSLTMLSARATPEHIDELTIDLRRLVDNINRKLGRGQPR